MTAKSFWLLLEFHVAELRFYTGIALSEMMRPGDTLSLMAEPNNEHDPRTVRLDFGDMHVGHVPVTTTRSSPRCWPRARRSNVGSLRSRWMRNR